MGKRLRIVTVLGTIIFSVLLLAGIAMAAGRTVRGPMGFEPIAGSPYGQLTADWTEPFIIPDGFSQEKLSDETDLDIYFEQSDLDE